MWKSILQAVAAVAVFSAVLSSSRILVAAAYYSLWETLWYGSLFPSVLGILAFLAYVAVGRRVGWRVHMAALGVYGLLGGLTDSVVVLYIPAGIALAAGLWAAAGLVRRAVWAVPLGVAVDVSFRLAAAGAEPWESPFAPLYSLYLVAGAAAGLLAQPAEPVRPGLQVFYWLAAAELGAAYPNAVLRMAGVHGYGPLEISAAAVLVEAGYIAGAALPAWLAPFASSAGVALLAMAPWLGPVAPAWGPLLAAGSTAALKTRSLGGPVAGAAYFILLMVAAVGVYAYPYLGLWPLADAMETVISLSALASLSAVAAGKAAATSYERLRIAGLASLALLFIGAASLVYQDSTLDAAVTLDATIVSYNVHQGFTPYGNLNSLDIIKTIEEVDPDLACLQEVDGGRLTSAYIDLPLLLDVKGYHVIYQPAIEGAYGVLIASKAPIEYGDGLLLPSEGEQRAAVKASSSGLTALNAHLGLDPSERLVQARVLLEAALEDPEAVIICGDFNEEKGAAIEALSEVFLLPKPVDWYTCCIGEDFKGVIDYVGVRVGSGLRIVDYYVYPSEASDHLPVVAVVKRG